MILVRKAAGQGRLRGVPSTKSSISAGSELKATPKPASVADAAESGSHRDLLVAMRARIARAVANPDCPPRDLAALTRRLQEIAKEIEQIDIRSKQEGDQGGFVADEEWNEAAL